MALSFQDSLKAAQAESEAVATAASLSAVAEDASVMTLGYDAATDDGGTLVVYAGDGGNWVQDTKYLTVTSFYDENICKVDDEKNVALNRKQFNITQEENSQYIPFEMARYYDGFDLTTTMISIHYETSDDRHGVSIPINVTYNDEKIRFGWLADAGVTHVAGKIKFEIHATGAVVDRYGNLVYDENNRPIGYVWKSKVNESLNVLQSLCGSECDGSINIDDSWVTELVTKIALSVGEEIKNAELNDYVTETELSNELSRFPTTVELDSRNYTSKEYVDNAIAGVDVSEQLKSYALTEDVNAADESLSTEIKTVSSNLSTNYYTKTDADLKIGSVLNEGQYATKPYVDEQIAAADISGKLADYYKKSETYNKDEVDNAVANVKVDLSGYYTKSEVDDTTGKISSSVATNTNNITTLTNAITTINRELESIDKSPRVTYHAEYGDVEMDDGSTAEYMFTLYETEGEGEPTVKSRFQIMGGGGGGAGSSVTLRIAYVEGYTTPLVATVNDPVIVKYEFSGEDSAGDTALDGVASWKVGNRVVATEDVATGTCEFDLTDYVAIGDNKVTLTITHATGAIATKAWTVKVVDVRLESSFDDTKTNPANQPVNFTFTPYGSIAKTVHFLLDGEEIATKTSTAAASGLSDSYAIPAQRHGTHLFEIYMTAEINGKTIESNHIVKDIIWYNEDAIDPVIGTVHQNFTARQYEATNIVYTVYDPSTETPSVNLRATYINEDGETVEEYNSNVVMSSNTATWQYKADVVGEHTLTITCGETVKTLIANIVELGINVSPITAGLVFDFNPVGYSNNDANRLWTYGDSGIGMTVSENFDWVNGGYQIDNNGDQCFCIKAGTSAEINYELFGDDAKTSGKQFKLIFKTENVADGNATFLSCVSDTIGTDKVGIEMLAQQATIYAKTESLPLPYAEEEITEFEFNITSSTQVPSMVMGYEDGVSTRPLVYDATHDFQQHKDHRKIISLGSDDCDLYIYRFKVYNTSLSDRDILNNFIADARSAEEMIDRFDRNQIYNDGILTPEYLAEMCPQLRIIKIEAPRFTTDKDDKVNNTTVECIYKGGDPIYDNWVAYNACHSGQGTSSNNYGPSARNLDLILKKYKAFTYDSTNEPYIVLGDGTTQVKKVSLTRDSVDVDYFNVKVNVASSENANNALLQKRYNQYNPYKRPFVREDVNETHKIKDTMEHQNCVIFIKESDPDLSTHVEFADNLYHFYAIGSIGDSKKTDDTRLTDPSDPYECILEVMDNTLPLSTMPTGKVDENGVPVYPIDPSEWTVGNTAYDDLMAEVFDELKADDPKKTNGKADTYGWRYLWEDGSDEENDEARAYVENAWRDFYRFVVTSTDEEFKTHLGDYVVLDSVMYYYLFILRYTMTDNFAKNSFWHLGKSNDLDENGIPIRKWDLCFDYDNDTALGITLISVPSIKNSH